MVIAISIYADIMARVSVKDDRAVTVRGRNGFDGIKCIISKADLLLLLSVLLKEVPQFNLTRLNGTATLYDGHPVLLP